MGSNSVSRFFNHFRSKSAEESNVSADSSRLADDASDLPAVPVAQSAEDYSLVAVITAAVAMMLSKDSGSSAPYPGFRVRRIRRLM